MKKSLLWWGLGIVALIALFYGLSRSSDNGSTEDVANGSHKRGAESGSVTLVEFADFQCPACASYHTLIKQLYEEYGDRVTFVFRHYPLIQIHPNALLSSQAAAAADAQGKFWEMHDLLFERQNNWSGSSDPTELFVGYAKELLLNEDQFRADLKNSDVKKKVLTDLSLGQKIKVNATPTFFVNGQKIDNPQSLEAFQTIMNNALLGAAATQTTTGTEPQIVHEHADLSVMLAGEQFDFSAAKYQSSEEKARDPFVHMHDGKGTMIHLHRARVTLAEYFKTLGIAFEKNCFKIDSGKAYCNDDKNTLKLFVNDQANDQLQSYVIKDLDRILISYGPTEDPTITSQTKSVPDEACIYSEKCPERGKPPTESCVGGLGTGCEG